MCSHYGRGGCECFRVYGDLTKHSHQCTLPCCILPDVDQYEDVIPIVLRLTVMLFQRPFFASNCRSISFLLLYSVLWMFFLGGGHVVYSFHCFVASQLSLKIFLFLFSQVIYLFYHSQCCISFRILYLYSTKYMFSSFCNKIY